MRQKARRKSWLNGSSGRGDGRFAFAYGTAFAVLYAYVRAKGLVLFTFYPTLGIFLVGLHRSRDVADPALEFLAPEMYWYGWTATAAIGALMFGLVAALLPDRWARWFRPGWLWVAPVFATNLRAQLFVAPAAPIFDVSRSAQSILSGVILVAVHWRLAHHSLRVDSTRRLNHKSRLRPITARSLSVK